MWEVVLGLVVAAFLVACAEGDAPGAPDAAGGGEADAAEPIDAAPPPDATPTIDARVPRCGDGLIDNALGEICDDGNTMDGDGCSGGCFSVECPATNAIEDVVTHRCYWRETTVTSRQEAENACLAKGGTLFRWADAAERDYAYQATVGTPGGKVWIGLTLVGATWTWDDGTAAVDVNFRDGEPSGDGACVEWGPGNSLNDIPCDVDRDYVCERGPAGTPAP